MALPTLQELGERTWGDEAPPCPVVGYLAGQPLYLDAEGRYFVVKDDLPSFIGSRRDPNMGHAL